MGELREVNAGLEGLSSELRELRPLPLGVAEFEEWSDRIIQGAMLTAHAEDQKGALGDMILHLNPTEDFKEDVYFIKRLRKVANNQVAHERFCYYREKVKARAIIAEEESKNKILEEGKKLFNPGQASAATSAEAVSIDGKILENKEV